MGAKRLERIYLICEGKFAVMDNALFLIFIAVAIPTWYPDEKVII